MKMKLICDSNQNAAAERLLLKVHKLQKTDDVIVITPENATLWAESFLARTSKNGAISGILVTNISRLFSKMYPSVLRASNQFCTMLVKRAISSTKLLAYGKVSKDFGFATKMYEVIRQMGQSGIDPQLLSSDSKTSLDLKLLDIGNIWLKYQCLLPDFMADQTKQIQLVKQKAKNGFFAGKTVCFVGFDDLSETMSDFVQIVVKRASTVYASVVESDNTKYVNSPVADIFLNIAKNTNASVDFERKNSLAPRELQIATSLFAKEKVPQEVSGIQIFACNSKRDETAFVADQILDLVLSGTRQKDIEIVAPNIEQYETAIKDAFSQRGLFLYSDTPKNAAYHPFFRLVEKYLKLAVSRKKVCDVISLMKNVLLNVDVQALATYENFCDKFGVEYDDFFGSLKIGVADPDFEVANQMHGFACKMVKSLPNAKATAKEFVESLFDFLSAQNIEQNLLNYASYFDGEERKISEKIFELAKSLAKDIEFVFGEEQIDAKTFFDVWQSGVVSTKLRLVPPITDAILLSNLETSKHSSKPYIFVVGAVEGDFPGLLQDNGMLSDKELEIMEKEKSIVMRPTVCHVNQLQKQKVSEIFECAQKGLIITFPNRVSGEQKQPSSIVTSLCDICLKNGKPLQILPASPQNYAEAKEQLKRKAKTPFGVKELVLLARQRMLSNKSLLGSAEIFGSAKMALGKEFEQEKEVSKIEKAKELFFEKGKTSISELETYFSCPYLHFAKYGLGVREKEQAELQAFDIGNFLHKCLEKLAKKMIGRKEEVSNAEFSAMMKSILSQVVKEEKYQAKVNVLQLEALKQEACRLCYAVVVGIEHSGFKPKAAEIVFGRNGDLPEVSFDKTDVVLEGKIDRFDTCDKMARVIDYKTGQVDLGIDNLYYGKKVQLFAYLLSVLKSGEYKPAGVFYLPIKSTFRRDTDLLESYKLQGYFSGAIEVLSELDHDLSLDEPESKLVEAAFSTSKENKLLGKKVLKAQSHIVSGEDLEKLAGYAKEVMQTAICEIEQGNANPSPLEKSGSKPCDYCVFKGLCKIAEHPENVRYELDRIGTSEVIGAVDNGTNE